MSFESPQKLCWKKHEIGDNSTYRTCIKALSKNYYLALHFRLKKHFNPKNITIIARSWKKPKPLQKMMLRLIRKTQLESTKTTM